MRALILSGVLALGMAGPAAADGLERTVQMFERYCVANRSQAEAVQLAAARDGFAVRPELRDVVARDVPGGVVMALLEDGRAYLVTTGRELVEGAIRTDICNVQVDPAPDAGSATAAMTRWVGFQPSRTTSQAVIWGYVDDGDRGRIQLEALTPEAMRLAFAEGRVRVVTIDVEGGRNSAGLMFTVANGDVPR